MARRRARRGTGSVVPVRRPDKTVQGYRARATLPDGRTSATFRTSGEAEEWLDNELNAVRNGKPRPSLAAKRGFGELVAIWRETRLAGVQPKTRARYEQIVRTYLEPEYRALPVSALTRERVRLYFARLTNAGTSAGTVAKVQVVLSSILSEAVENGILATNPAAKLKGLPKPTKRELVVLSAAEVQKLADACAAHGWQKHPVEHPQDALAVLIAAHAGPRADELWALQRRDYNPLRGTLTIERAWKDNARTILGTTKTGSKRVVGLPATIRALLDEHLADVEPEPTAFLFSGPGGANGRTTGNGGPIRHELWRARVFRPALKRALPTHPDLHFHDLRHTCASWLIASGADALQVKSWMGHASIKTTYDVYGHLMPNNVDGLVDRLEALHAADNVTPLRKVD